MVKASSAIVSDLVAEGADRTPIRTDTGVLFVHKSPADRVEVVVMEDRFPQPGPMQRFSGTDFWYVEIPLEPDGTIEYKLGIDHHGKHRLILDPLNPDVSTAPFGSNSIASGKDYRPPAWLTAESIPPGAIHQFPVKSRIWGRRKDHQIYIPALQLSDRPLPLLLLHDGPEYVRYAGLAECLDWLIATRRIPPVLVFLHQPHARNEEYVGNLLHERHLMEEVLPLLQANHAFEGLYAGGASLGAVASLTAAFPNPGAFAGLMLQSGSFVRKLGGPYNRPPVLNPVIEQLPLILENPGHLPGSLVFSCGTYDGLVEDHRRLIPELSEIHQGVSYREIHAGHHWRCWRDALESDLLRLFNPV